MFYVLGNLRQRFVEMTLYELQKSWDVTEIMKEYVTLTEYLHVIGKNIECYWIPVSVAVVECW
jgi:hypothetical protein